MLACLPCKFCFLMSLSLLPLSPKYLHFQNIHVLCFFMSLPKFSIIPALIFKAFKLNTMLIMDKGGSLDLRYQSCWVKVSSPTCLTCSWGVGWVRRGCRRGGQAAAEHLPASSIHLTVPNCQGTKVEFGARWLVFWLDQMEGPISVGEQTLAFLWEGCSGSVRMLWPCVAVCVFCASAPFILPCSPPEQFAGSSLMHALLVICCCRSWSDLHHYMEG